MILSIQLCRAVVNKPSACQKINQHVVYYPSSQTVLGSLFSVDCSSQYREREGAGSRGIGLPDSGVDYRQ